jgi:hypothetical protein
MQSLESTPAVHGNRPSFVNKGAVSLLYRAPQGYFDNGVINRLDVDSINGRRDN